MGFLAKDEDSGAGRIDERIGSREQSIGRFMRTPCDEVLLLSARTSVPSADAAQPWILAATILGSSMAFIDGTVVNVVLPTLQTTFHASVVDVQWVVESYGIFLSALILAGGAFGDLFGRRRIFLVGVGVFAAASIACGLSSSIQQLIAARSAQGVGAALLVPSISYRADSPPFLYSLVGTSATRPCHAAGRLANASLNSTSLAGNHAYPRIPRTKLERMTERLTDSLRLRPYWVRGVACTV